MEDQRFDSLSRRLGAGLSRRRALGALLGALAGGVALTDDAAARRRETCRAGGQQCTRDGQCCLKRCVQTGNARDRGNRCACPAGQTICGTRCVNLQDDERNCGACGRRCKKNEQCCGGRCIALGTPDNCSGCGDVCAPGDSCVDGICTSTCGGVQCEPTESCCNNECIDTSDDPDNCGACGVSGDACCNGVPTTLGTDSDCDDCADTCSAGTTCYPFPRHADGSFAGAECCDCTDHCGGENVVYCGGMCPDRCTGEQICNTQTGVCEDPPVCSVAFSGSSIETAISVEGTLKQFDQEDYSISTYYFYTPDGYGNSISGATPCTADKYCEDNCPAKAMFGRTVVGCQCTQYVCDGPKDETPYHLIGENLPGGETGKYYCSVIYKDQFDEE